MQQYGIHYTDTYAPVVSWSTVRLILTLTALFNFKCRQIDFDQAFTQAALDTPIYMALPDGWHHTDDNGTPYVMKLNKNLYGTKQAAHTWFLHLRNVLIGNKGLGFKQSKIDPCLFLRNDALIVLYTDDCLIFSLQDSIIQDIIKGLKTNHLLLKDQGEVADFLGIRVCRSADNSMITMTQTGLIDDILKQVGMDATGSRKHETTAPTPAGGLVFSDPNSAPHHETWNYRSVIGKLNFLAMNTCPDIAYAVHQCARFSNAPKKCHKTAVLRIVRYLKGTRNEGMILRPQSSYALDAFCDSDYAGNYHSTISDLRESVLSRTGYIITYCNCPIVWSSKLQSIIALSSTESEYIALSTCARELIPLRTLIRELMAKGPFMNLNIQSSTPATTSFTTNIEDKKLGPSTIYEDNQACLILATSEGAKQRTKHIAVCYHHFRDEIRNGNIMITKVATTNNWADIFTKALARPLFTKHRSSILGW